MKSLLFTLGLVGLLEPTVAAQEPPTPPAGLAREAEEAGEEPRNEVALVLAGTRERAEDETSFTIGGEYERRLTDRLGVVAELEYVSGPDSWVFAVPLVFRPAGGFKLFAGPGLERAPVHGESETHEPEASTGKARDNLFLWRVGTGYSWEFAERYVVGPSVYLDFIREEESEWTQAFVFGISLGVAF
jgi:hypothetical protein